MLNTGKFICACCMYITYNIGNYNRHLNSKRHQKKNSLDNPVGKPDNDLLHKTPEFEKDSSEIKKDSLDKLVGKIENDLLHENSNSDIYICLKCNYKTAICSNYYRHLRTKKHLCKDYEITEKTYECNNCKFKSKYKSNYKRHLKSKKHLMVINASKNPMNFSEFIKLINIEINDIESIIIIGLLRFTVNKIKQLYLDIKIKPIYCNDFKRKKFMIYETNNWLLVNKNILNMIVDEIQKNILQCLNKWKKENRSKYPIERLNEIYLHIINICSENLSNNKIFINDVCRVFKST